MVAEIPVYNASTGEVLQHVPEAGGEGVAAAVERARSASREWRSIGAVARGQAVADFGRAVADHAEELAGIDARNAGNPITGMRRGAQQGARTLEYFAGLALELTGETIPATPDHLHYTLREPFGVVGVITPFNHPTLFATARTAAPLVAGNAVVLKPAHQTPLSALRLQELADEHLPPGVFTVVTGGGATGSALVRHPEVRRIGFTGGVETARRIASDAADSGTIKRISYELGGKNAMVILPDVDIDVAAAAAVEGMNLTRVAGQSCGSTSRLFVHSSICDDLRDRVVKRLEQLRFGPPEEESTQIGSLVSEQQRERVERYVRAGREEGAQLVLGGERPTEPPFDRGFYFPPTLFERVRSSMTIAREEIFGPVLCMISWTDEAEMLAAVNDSRYGLTASVYTNDLRAAHRLAGAIEAGYIWINDVEKRWIGVPFGGQKDSGTGTEYSIEELYSFTQNKSISVSLR
ncbi:MAG TPA: aldehyde dehydrogenase family protein [Candidatus Limnocylindria bacterium]|nr:aldehyde dehydrogenase family protein [Candidatus Limnocylindria bacterium]